MLKKCSSNGHLKVRLALSDWIVYILSNKIAAVYWGLLTLFFNKRIQDRKSTGIVLVARMKGFWSNSFSNWKVLYYWMDLN